MSEYDKQLKNYEYLVIPTKNIFDIHNDESGCIRLVAGVAEEDDENEIMMLFCDGNSITNGNLYEEFGNDEY